MSRDTAGPGPVDLPRRAVRPVVPSSRRGAAAREWLR